jgi:hypothetical protein
MHNKNTLTSEHHLQVIWEHPTSTKMEEMKISLKKRKEIYQFHLNREGQ